LLPLSRDRGTPQLRTPHAPPSHLSDGAAHLDVQSETTARMETTRNTENVCLMSSQHGLLHHLVWAHIQSSIYLDWVSTDDFTIQALSQLEPYCGLTHSSGSSNDDHLQGQSHDDDNRVMDTLQYLFSANV
jgi:hypothetical protein